MTDERKQELTQLLQEALANLEIRRDSADRYECIPVEAYEAVLKQHWTSYSLSPDLLSYVISYEPHIINGSMTSKLLDFIREEFSEFIHEDYIQSASVFIGHGSLSGYPLDHLLKQLLKIAIVLGVEKAVSDFDRCTKNPSGSFQYIALLQGIEVETEIQVVEGIQIVPLPNSTSELPHYFLSGLDLEPSDFRGKTLLVIDASVSPIFCKPPPLEEDFLDHPPFEVEVTGKNFLNVNVDNSYFIIYSYVDKFYNDFCRALSLTCKSAVQLAVTWTFLEKYELFNLMHAGGNTWRPLHYIDRLGAPTVAEETQIGEAKRLYETLINSSSNLAEKLQIPIVRWIKSKTSRAREDKIIDLVIALEALYLSDRDVKSEYSFQLRLRAAWHLGKDQAHRKELMKDFRDIYEWRSTVVHTGKLPRKQISRNKKRPYTPEEVSEFITRAQDLCRDSILKILEDGKFPDWNDLILGEESLY